MKSLAFSRRVANQRPYPTSSGGTGGTLIIRRTAIPAVATPSQVRRGVVVNFDTPSTATGTSVINALTAATAINSRCDERVPSHAMISRLPNSAPMMPPIVFAAYTLPTSRAGSFAPRPTAASASGKLAPQSTAAGKTDQRQRTRSIWNVGVASMAKPGLTGQYGRTLVIEYAAHAIAPVSSSWQTPSANRGCLDVRANADPTVLPRPRPSRNAARISENV